MFKTTLVMSLSLSSYDVPHPSYDEPPYPSYDGQGTSYDVWGTSFDGFALFHILFGKFKMFKTTFVNLGLSWFTLVC